MSSIDEDCNESKFAEKFREVCDCSLFKDIAFNCKDGKIYGNRLLLSVYSSFLEDVFRHNPMIVSSHELCRTGDEGINLPEICVEDMQALLEAIVAGSSMKQKRDKMDGIRFAANTLKITITETIIFDEFVEFVAIPDAIKDTNERKQTDLNDEDIIEKENDAFDSSSRSKVCPHCSITCKSWQGVKRHIGHYHGNTTKTSHKEQVKCKCGLSFSKNAKKLFKEHRRMCLSYIATAFICDICQVPFHEMPSLNNHKFTVHGVALKPNSCICGQVLQNRHQLRKHFINCSVYKKAAVFCDDCNLPFLTSNHLQQHYNSASHKLVQLELIAKGLKKEVDDEEEFEAKDSKIVTCKCGQYFSRHSRSLYREHRRTCDVFLNDASICELCNNPFEDMISLSIHKTAVHGVNKTSNSCCCDRVFINRNQLRKHQINCEMYKSLAIICKECNLPFPSHSHFQQHLKSTLHKNVVKNNVEMNLDGSSQF